MWLRMKSIDNEILLNFDTISEIDKTFATDQHGKKLYQIVFRRTLTDYSIVSFTDEDDRDNRFEEIAQKLRKV
jgi:hypothetical protein